MVIVALIAIIDVYILPQDWETHILKEHMQYVELCKYDRRITVKLYLTENVS